MHIPDHVLSEPVAAATGAIALGTFGYGLKRLERRLRERTTVLMGIMAAFIFAAQMVNFPLLVLPASGHLIGGVLAAVMLGPWAGAVVMGTVLIVQCLLFADGGVLALGANFVNLGLIASVGGYAIYDPIRRGIGGRAGVLVGAMVAAWFSVLLASAAFAVELAASGRWAELPEGPGLDGAGPRGHRAGRGDDHRPGAAVGPGGPAGPRLRGRSAVEAGRAAGAGWRSGGLAARWRWRRSWRRWPRSWTTAWSSSAAGSGSWRARRRRWSRGRWPTTRSAACRTWRAVTAAAGLIGTLTVFVAGGRPGLGLRRGAAARRARARRSRARGAGTPCGLTGWSPTRRATGRCGGSTRG